jgi:hypothetical protein
MPGGGVEWSFGRNGGIGCKRRDRSRQSSLRAKVRSPANALIGPRRGRLWPAAQASGTGILLGQVLLVGAIAMLFVWAATQWTDWRLASRPRSATDGEAAPGWPVYPPPAFFVWWYWYDAYAPQVFMEGAYIASAGGFVSIAVAMAMSVWRAREAKDVSTLRLGPLGDARRLGRRGSARLRWRRAREAPQRLSSP